MINYFTGSRPKLVINVYFFPIEAVVTQSYLLAHFITLVFFNHKSSAFFILRALQHGLQVKRIRLKRNLERLEWRDGTGMGSCRLIQAKEGLLSHLERNDVPVFLDVSFLWSTIITPKYSLSLSLKFLLRLTLLLSNTVLDQCLKVKAC